MKTNTNTQYLEKLISEGEHVHQDFKFAISDARKIAKSLSAFANTEGGRLLVGVKDNGKIAGVRSEEELYMIEAAANLYCRPEVELDTRIYHVDGKDVLEVQVNESQQKPIYALDEENRPWAYVRIKDENILANPIHLNIWKHDRAEKDVVMTYTQREQQVLTILQQHAPPTRRTAGPGRPPCVDAQAVKCPPCTIRSRVRHPPCHQRPAQAFPQAC